MTIDTVAPAAPSAPDLDPTSDTGGSNTDDRTTDDTPTVTGMAEGDALVTLFEESTSLGSTAAVGGAWSITSSSLADGAHSLTAVAADAAGNSGPPSAAIVVTVVPAEVSLLWPAPDGLLFEEETLAAETIGDPVASVEFLVDGLVVGTAPALPFEVTWDTTTATGGTHVFEARATLVAGGSVTSTAVSAIVDNTLSSVERLDADLATNRVTIDDYALNGVYAVAAPVALDERYQSVSAPEPAPNQIDVYLATWDDLAAPTQDAINEFLAQPLRGEFYALSVLPVTRTPVTPPAIADACDHVEEKLEPFGPIIGTADECIHENDTFAISYFLNGTGTFTDDTVTSPIVNGTPKLIADYMTGLTDALEVYETDLGYTTDWQGKVPVEIHNACGERCGRVLLQGIFAGGIFDSVQTIEMSPVSGAPFYLAHHELFHVMEYPIRRSVNGLVARDRWLLADPELPLAGRVECRLGGGLRHAVREARGPTAVQPVAGGVPRPTGRRAQPLRRRSWWSPVRRLDLPRVSGRVPGCGRHKPHGRTGGLGADGIQSRRTRGGDRARRRSPRDDDGRGAPGVLEGELFPRLRRLRRCVLLGH